MITISRTARTHDGSSWRCLAFLAAAALVGCKPVKLDWAHPVAAPVTVSLDSLTALVNARIVASGATVGFYFRDLAKPDSLAINADLRVHAASTMKVPVMIQVFRDVEAGQLSLDQRLTVTNDFRSFADSSPYRLDRADDSDSSLYGQVGRPVSVRDLVRLMITVSSNLATNTLIERVGAARVMATLRALGIDSVAVLRGVEDGVAYRAGINNTLTARGLGQVFAAIADGRAAGATSCARMMDVLLDQHFNEGIPAGLPQGTRVAHKTGELTGLHHDGGVVFVDGRPRYILIVLTRGLEDRARSSRLIADLAGMVNQHVVPPPPPPPGSRIVQPAARP
ncbi:MAG: serine hydrolase [Gemmatimonadales bacterium]